MKYNTNKEFSFFRLSLNSYLRDNHPHLVNDEDFTNTRVELAEEAFEHSLANGNTPDQALVETNDVLYNGLHFSMHSIIINILWDEFPSIIPEDDAKRIATKLYPQFEEIRSKYIFSDNFEESDEYNEFYTELVGAITLELEGYGI